MIYLITYISLMVSGGGRLSIDYLIKRKMDKT